MVLRPAPSAVRPSVPTDRSTWRAASLGVAGVAAVAVLAVWWAFVRTARGQQLDRSAILGAEYGQNRLMEVADPVLSVISVPFIGVVLVSAMLLAVLRRRALLAIQVALLVGGANLSTQVLKRWVLDRPDLGTDYPMSNSLPSGHTTAAASVAAAALFVVPRRMRPVMAVVGAGYTAATGISTLVGQWHRPSDVVAAVLVVLAWAGVAGALGPASGEPPAGWRVVAVGLVVAGAAAAAGAAVALSRTLSAVDAGLEGRAELLTAYGGGALGVVATVAVTFGVLLVLRRGGRPATAS